MKQRQQKQIALQRHYYTQTAQEYDNTHGGSHSEHNIALRYISGLLPMLEAESALDVGCGTGRGLLYFQEQHPTINVVGIDPVRALVDQAIHSNGLTTSNLTVATGECLPFDDQSFDVVFELGILHHVARPASVVTDMMRVARKAIFISDMNRFAYGSMPLRLAKFSLYKLGLWNAYFLLRTGGRGYFVTEGDGLAYSYSIYDSFDALSSWGDTTFLIPLSRERPTSWYHPLLTASHVLLCALRVNNTPPPT